MDMGSVDASIADDMLAVARLIRQSRRYPEGLGIWRKDDSCAGPGAKCLYNYWCFRADGRMNLRCLLGIHDWSKTCDKCVWCDASRTHEWVGCQCQSCSDTRDSPAARLLLATPFSLSFEIRSGGIEVCAAVLAHLSNPGLNERLAMLGTQLRPGSLRDDVQRAQVVLASETWKLKLQHPLLADKEYRYFQRSCAIILDTVEGPDFVESAIEILSNPDKYRIPGVVWLDPAKSAANTLSFLADTRAIRPLVESITDNRLRPGRDYEPRKQLARFTSDEAVDQFLTLLRENLSGFNGWISAEEFYRRSAIRTIVAEQLARLGSPRAVQPLFDALEKIRGQRIGSGSVLDAEYAALQDSLGRLQKDGDTAEAIFQISIEGVGKGDCHTRAAAVRALRRYKDPRSLPCLLSAVKWFAHYESYDSDKKLFWGEVIESLEEFPQLPPQAIGPLAIGLICAESTGSRDRVVRMLEQFKEAPSVTTPILLRLLPTETAGAAEAIGILGLCGAVPSLIHELGRTNSDQVVASLAWALGRCPDSRSVEPLASALGKGTGSYWGRIREQQIARALGKIADARAVDALANFLKSCATLLREHYRYHHAETVELWNAHEATRWALGRIETPEAQEALRHAGNDPFRSIP